MTELIEQSAIKIQRTPDKFQRFLLNEISWGNRLIGLKGARGVGKTTLLLQRLKKLNLPPTKAVYFSLDELYFLSNSLFDVGKDFYMQGGQIMVLDEVHKYANWSREIKVLYDRYPDLKIIFTGSSIIDIARQEADLSRRALMYELPGMSFREYLEVMDVVKINPISIKNILKGSGTIFNHFPAGFKPLEHLSNYLKYGYYPFFLEDKENYHQRLRQLVRTVIEYDMAELKGFDIRNAKKMLQLISLIAGQVPFKPNLLKLSERSGIHRNSISNYLYHLEQERLIKLLYPSGISVSTLQKPEKIYIDNPNLMEALANEKPSIGNIRETFFYNQLQFKNSLTQPKNGDFQVNNKFIFEIGGERKSRKQIKEVENSFIVRDKLEFPAGNALPLWVFGFLY